MSDALLNFDFAKTFPHKTWVSKWSSEALEAIKTVKHVVQTVAERRGITCESPSIEIAGGS